MATDGTDGATPVPEASLPLDLYEAGDERFVAALRRVGDAPSLARFAATWYADPRPEARGLLLAYLAEPPNAPGHEGLVKRLFKLAEGAGDDEAMAHLLVLCDRLIDRRYGWGRRVGGRLEDHFATAEEATARAAEWTTQGWAEVRTFWSPPDQPRWFYTTGRPPIRTARRSTLPRPDGQQGEALAALTPDAIAERRWFTVATRRHLQRRAWRYFRRLGQTDPARFVAAATTALTLYRDADTADGLSLLDRFGLLHLLFRASPALHLRSTGWDLAPGHSLADLAPAPAYAGAWRDRPEAILTVFRRCESSLVNRWAWSWIEADPERFRALVQPEDCGYWLVDPDPAVVAGVIRWLDGSGSGTLPAVAARESWDALPWGARPGCQSMVADFIGRIVGPEAASRRWGVALANRRAEAVARLGWGWIMGQGVATVPTGLIADTDADASLLLDLLNARCPALRPTILRELRLGLARRPGDRVAWVGAFLSHPSADARAEGLAWLRADDALWRDADLWAKLAESPHPDVRALVATARPPVPVDPARLDGAHAAVLLAPKGLARAKPSAIRGVVRRLEALAMGGEDAEIEALLGLLADLTRSSHAPARRASLAALVGLAQRVPEWAGRVEGLVPALQLGGGSAIVPGSVPSRIGLT